jgi:hypothetical protein
VAEIETSGYGAIVLLPPPSSLALLAFAFFLILLFFFFLVLSESTLSILERDSESESSSTFFELKRLLTALTVVSLSSLFFSFTLLVSVAYPFV